MSWADNLLFSMYYLLHEIACIYCDFLPASSILVRTRSRLIRLAELCGRRLFHFLVSRISLAIFKKYNDYADVHTLATLVLVVYATSRTEFSNVVWTSNLVRKAVVTDSEFRFRIRCIHVVTLLRWISPLLAHVCLKLASLIEYC